MARDVLLADRLRRDPVLAPHVVEVAGWRTRGSASFNPRGFVWHHTAGPRKGAAPSLTVCIYGRTGLPGPLCNVFLARDGRVFVVAAGRANHAGSGSWRGLSGNSSVYGLEVENTGYGSGPNAEPWSELVLDRAARIAAQLPVTVEMCCHHKEWTTRKVDMHTVEGTAMRRRVIELRSRPPAAPKPAPASPPAKAPVPNIEEGPVFLLIQNVGLFAVVDGIPVAFKSLNEYAEAKKHSEGVPVLTLPEAQGRNVLERLLLKTAAATAPAEGAR